MSESIPAGFREALGPQLFKFEKPGQELRGVFLEAKTEIIQGDKVLEIYISKPTGSVHKFRPGYDVRSKINRGMLGKELLIRYLGDDHEKGKDGNPLKVFGVYVKERETGPDGDPGIDDTDIPF